MVVVQPRSCIELGEQELVQSLPHPGLVPVPQPARTRHARAEAQFLGQVLPLDAGMQHMQDSAQHVPVRKWFAARMLVPPLPPRQQRFDPLPQFTDTTNGDAPMTRPTGEGRAGT